MGELHIKTTIFCCCFNNATISKTKGNSCTKKLPPPFFPVPMYLQNRI